MKITFLGTGTSYGVPYSEKKGLSEEVFSSVWFWHEPRRIPVMTNSIIIFFMIRIGN